MATVDLTPALPWGQGQETAEGNQEIRGIDLSEFGVKVGDRIQVCIEHTTRMRLFFMTVLRLTLRPTQVKWTLEERDHSDPTEDPQLESPHQDDSQQVGSQREEVNEEFPNKKPLWWGAKVICRLDGPKEQSVYELLYVLLHPYLSQHPRRYCNNCLYR
jgi:hypothetical protein